MEQVAKNTIVDIRRRDDELRVVYGQVYAPYQLDSQTDMMTPEGVRKLAHDFLRLDLSKTIDVMHDNNATDNYPVESFIAREGDPDYDEGAWVLGVKIVDDEMWERVLRGEINGFSFQALARAIDVEVEYDVVRDHVGKVQKADDHDHVFFLTLDQTGRVTKGWTSPGPDGHVHTIRRSSKTEEAGGHAHRFFV